MKNLFFFLCIASLTLFSCSGSVQKMFAKRSAHESYADKVKKTEEGQHWIEVSRQALLAPVDIELPYSQLGYFNNDKTRALTFRFAARQGERLQIELKRTTPVHSIIFADLYRQDGINASHLLEADSSNTRFAIDADVSGNYLLRLQPGLQQKAAYELTITLTPSLAFPVAGKKAKAGSFWGADRDGGKRAHEGVDIFAPKLTPAIAAADGFVTAVRDGGLGGKTVWMRTVGRDFNLYYAHLDKQLVSAGQLVKKGDTLGLVGNTGNAKHTPAHLHFGIYGNGGAVDPWPFIRQQVSTVSLPAMRALDGRLVVSKSKKGKKETAVPEKTILQPLAVTLTGYLAELPGGTLINIPFSAVKPIAADVEIAEKMSLPLQTAG